jgi:heptosyltransferase-2
VLSDLADDGYQPVVLGGADDVAEANQVQDRCRTLPLNLAGRLSLAELALLLSRAALLVTNDSGPMHVAGAVGAPLVAVFGSTTPALGYGPVGSPSRVVEHPLPCRPCGPHGRRRCPLDHFDCMKKIKAEEVVAACREALTGDAAT